MARNPGLQPARQASTSPAPLSLQDGLVMTLLLSSALSPFCHVTERVPRIPLGLVGEVLRVVRGEVANPANKAGQGHFL